MGTINFVRVLENARKRAYRSTVVILDVAIHLVAASSMHHFVFPFLVVKVVYLRRNLVFTQFMRRYRRVNHESDCFAI